LASENRLWKSRKAKPASQLSHSLDYYDFLTGYGIRILRARSINGTEFYTTGGVDLAGVPVLCLFSPMLEIKAVKTMDSKKAVAPKKGAQ
jgi:hypothetical protein